MFVQCYRFTLISTTVTITKQKIGLEGRKDIFSITFPLFKKCKFRLNEGERLATYRSELLNAVRCLNSQHWYRKVCERFVSQVSFYSFCKYQHKIRDRPDSETLCCLFYFTRWFRIDFNMNMAVWNASWPCAIYYLALQRHRTCHDAVHWSF